MSYLFKALDLFSSTVSFTLSFWRRASNYKLASAPINSLNKGSLTIIAWRLHTFIRTAAENLSASHGKGNPAVAPLLLNI
jgi:hypothetical protein